MAKAHPAVRLEQQRANLKRLEKKRRRLDTLIKSRKRSIGALGRRVVKVGPAPPPEPKAPAPPRGKRLDDPHLAGLQAAGDRAADALGVKRPKVRWTGTLGACMNHVRRAHIHTYDRKEVIGRTSFRYSKRLKRTITTPAKWHTFRRGDVCVRRDWFVYGTVTQDDYDGLMAHEVSHLAHKRSQRFLGHGKKFDSQMNRALNGMGRIDLVARNGHHYPCPEAEAVKVAAQILAPLEA